MRFNNPFLEACDFDSASCLSLSYWCVMLFKVVAPNGDYFLLQSCKFVLPSDHCSKTVSLVITFHLFSLSTPVFAIYLGQLLLDLFFIVARKDAFI